MKRVLSGVSFAFLAATVAWGQLVQVDSIAWRGLPANQPGGVIAQATGALGSQYLYYWVTARYPAGVSTPAGPARANNTRGIAGLAPGSAVRIAWQAAPGATGYDVIRQANPAFPNNGQCLNCVVSSNQAGVTFLDIGGGVVNWPTPGTVPVRGNTITMAINNRDDNYPFFAANGEVHILPTRSTNENAYLFGIGGEMTGGAGQKTYALGITVARPPGSVATGDANDALIRGAYSNYAQNDANFLVNGINTTASNRSPGTLGILQGGNVFAGNRSGATAPIVRGLFVSTENFGVTANEFSGITVSLKNEGAKATLEFGVKVLNDNASLATAADAAFMVRSSGALKNQGFVYGLDMYQATLVAETRYKTGALDYSGNGAPNNAVCAAPTLGSTYHNLAGGAGTTFYVCEAAGGWVGK